VSTASRRGHPTLTTGRLILLNRSVLLIETAEIREVIDRYASGKPWQHRLANGAGVCVEAAREMVKLAVAMVDSGCPTYLTALTSPLSAVYALAVHIFRERHSLLIRSDFEVRFYSASGHTESKMTSS
jgi:hypothetical protein